MSPSDSRLVWRQTFKVTVIFKETAEEHEKHDDQSVTIFEAFNQQDCICDCEKLEDVQLEPRHPAPPRP